MPILKFDPMDGQLDNSLCCTYIRMRIITKSWIKHRDFGVAGRHFTIHLPKEIQWQFFHGFYFYTELFHQTVGYLRARQAVSQLRGIWLCHSNPLVPCYVCWGIKSLLCFQPLWCNDLCDVTAQTNLTGFVRLWFRIETIAKKLQTVVNTAYPLY